MNISVVSEVDDKIISSCGEYTNAAIFYSKYVESIYVEEYVNFSIDDETQ